MNDGRRRGFSGFAYRTIFLAGMEVFTEEHKGHEYTGKRIWNSAKGFFGDLGPMLKWPFPVFYDFVRQIPYIDDPDLTGEPFHEIVSRPAYLLNPKIFPAMDCKKKTTLILAYCLGNGIPCRAIASSENGSGEIHHIFPLVWDGEKWLNADATFWNYDLGQAKPLLQYAEDLPACE